VPGTPQTRQRDALIASLLAYSGLRSAELRALPFAAIRENTILVQRAANPDGLSKPTRDRQHRTVRLLTALAQDVREYKFATSRPPEKSLILLDDDRKPWDKKHLAHVARHCWAPACRAGGLAPTPRPYDLRYSFGSLLLAEDKQSIRCAKHLDTLSQVFPSTYSHLIDEFEDRERIDADADIATA
jgi:integrase